MDKVMRVYLCGEDWSKSHEEMVLDLPATPWKLVDVLDRLNLDSEEDLYVQAEEYYDFDFLQGFIPATTSLSQLNELCGVLGSMDPQDRISFRGLLQSSVCYGRGKLSFDRLMDIALSKNCCHIAEDVGNDEQLGRFLCTNGFIEGTEELPERIHDLLDYKRIGQQFRENEHGAFADGCYVAPDREIPHKEICYGISPPEYVVMMDVVNKENTNQHYLIDLPASSSELEYALSRIGAKSWDEATCYCIDCQVPQLIEALSKVNSISIANRFAAMFEQIPVKDIAIYKAALEAVECDDLTTASLIAQDLGSYYLSEDLRTPEDVGMWQLTYMLADKDRDLLVKHLNLYSYGKAVMEQDIAVMTTYGYIERRDQQPILGQNHAQSQDLLLQ